MLIPTVFWNRRRWNDWNRHHHWSNWNASYYRKRSWKKNGCHRMNVQEQNMNGCCYDCYHWSSCVPVRRLSLYYKSMKSCYEWKSQQKNVHRKNDCYELLLHYYYMNCYAYCLDGCKWNGELKPHSNGLHSSELQKNLNEL